MLQAAVAGSSSRLLATLLARAGHTLELSRSFGNGSNGELAERDGLAMPFHDHQLPTGALLSLSASSSLVQLPVERLWGAPHNLPEALWKQVPGEYDGRQKVEG